MTVSSASKKSVRSLRPVPVRKAPVRRSAPHDFPITADQYLKMGELGFFQDRRVELIEGRIIEMAPMNEGHWQAIAYVPLVLNRAFGQSFLVIAQAPLPINEISEPQPDFMVLKAPPKGQKATKSGALNKSVLVVEVSDSTLAYDRKTKAALYARAGVTEYWIINLKARQLEVLTEPEEGTFTKKQLLGERDFVTPLAAPRSKIAVVDLLP